MMRFGEALRLIHINWVLLRHGLDEIILAAHLFRPIRFLKYFSPFYWFSRGRRPGYGVRIRRALEDLGPIFIKFGQILSTRRDLLPDDVARELARLQDQVPPFAGSSARMLIEKALGDSIGNLFLEFNEEPLASASIAQVHTAKLKDGSDVVVKVVRPGIEKTIRRDVDLLFTIARLADRYSSEARRLRPVEVVKEYETTIFDELDLMREAANASQLRRNFENSPLLYVPDIHWDYCRPNVMVMERIYGTPVSRIDVLKQKGISMKMLGERGVEIFFTQVFRDNFFHADMHPGNIFVADDGRYMAVDFGIVGTLTESDKRYLAENFLAFFNRDYKRIAELHLESAWVPEETRVDQFESAIRAISEPVFNKPISEISFGHYLLRLFQTARRFNMQVQPQLVLLQKTLLNIEGLGRQIYPELDLWTTAKPFLERWMAEQVGPQAFLRKAREYLPRATGQLPELPTIAYRLLRDAEQGHLKLQWESQQLHMLQAEIRESNRRTVGAVAGAALLIGASLIAVMPPAWIAVGVAQAASAASGIAGALLLLRAWWR
ncbi:MAG: ubiquinone biosynthesis regulatory protein kinase UbiB [Gammaproteobacteria bacterium]|jgi:ubiquinone biosynthesis protein